MAQLKQLQVSTLISKTMIQMRAYAMYPMNAITIAHVKGFQHAIIPPQRVGKLL